MELAGTETDTIEIDGTLEEADARRLVGEGPAPELVSGGVRTRLLLFAMRDLRFRGAPGPSFDYNEALWLIGATYETAPCWFAVACDLDNWLVATSGAWIVRYPVRRATFAVERSRLRVIVP